MFKQILGTTKHLPVMEPKAFLSNVLLHLLDPSPNYDHMLFLAMLTKVSTLFFEVKN